MVECVCINDRERPAQIPEQDWIKEKEKYHITHVYIMKNQKGIQGVDIWEKPLSETNAPYLHFRANRFGVHEKDLQALMELIKNCNDLNDLDLTEIKELLESDLLVHL